jgi:hypothetical protein
MNVIINALEEQNNLRNFIKDCPNCKTAVNNDNRKTQVTLIEAKLVDLKLTSKNITEIKHTKQLINRQLTQFINKIDKNCDYPFSKSQGMSYSVFYTAPLLAVKNIIFSNYSGISGANLNLSVRSDDGVKNKIEFVNFLKKINEEFYAANNLYDLYFVFKSFDNGIKNQFIE